MFGEFKVMRAMAKAILGWIVMVFIPTVCSAQDVDQWEDPLEFEGIIRYSIALYSKIKDVPDKVYQDVYGHTLVLYFKHGRWRMSFDGDDLNEVFYFANENIEYTKRKGID